jgi:uncharacterized protein (TIGR02246 family)
MTIWQAIPAVLFLSGGLVSGVSVASAQSVEEEVTSAYAAWDEAFNSGEAAAVAEAYAEDATFLPPTHEVIEGPEAIQTFFDGILGMGVTGHNLELIEAHEAGDSIIAAARWSATGKDEAGADQPWGGIATHVFERDDAGNLTLRLHTFN